ncbi:MAG: class I SAM-dependent RNA methyltransferase [Anaeromyxobacteraceae bacterium]
MRKTLDILDVAPGGEGVARDDEARAVFVPFTAPGDRVAADVPGGSGVAHGSLLEVLAPGPDRVAPPCRHFGPLEAPGGERGCGGCEWLHLAYPAQLAAKARSFAETLRRIGRLEAGQYDARPIVGSPAPLRYRSRAKFHLDRRAGRLVFFRRRSHDPVLLRECHLLQAELDRLREEVGPALVAARLDAREVTLEWSAHQRRGAAYLKLAAVNAGAAARAEAFLAAVPSLAGAVLGAEGAPVAVVGDPVLLQARRPGEPAAGLQRSRPDVFGQANRGANALLVDAALALLAPAGEDVLELFCGAGNFTAPLAAAARSVAAVEVQGPALDLARRDAPANVRFFAGDALAVARGLARDGGARAPRFGAALLDPPREGARGVGPVLRDLGVARAVYVSCDPATFARDLKACGEAGYRVAAVQPVDMFPQTHHVEGVALLVRS